METWKQIPQAPDYEISSLGTVRRLIPSARNRIYNNPTPVILKRGYAYIGLRVKGKGKTFQHHRLVMAAFHGESELQVNHKNGNRYDNRLENLEYVTCHENHMHSRDVLRSMPQGEKHHNSKLTEADVRKIFALRQQGKTHYEIAAEIGCTRPNVGFILKRKAWAHIEITPMPPNLT